MLCNRCGFEMFVKDTTEHGLIFACRNRHCTEYGREIEIENEAEAEAEAEEETADEEAHAVSEELNIDTD